MRIAILADIHGNLPALEAVAGDLDRRGVDAVVNLGDSLSGPLLPRETAQFLMARDWLHLAGNHERQLLTLGPGQRCASDEFTHGLLTPLQLDWIASLRPGARFGPEIFLCHGTPASDVEYLLETVESTHIRPATPREIDTRLGGIDADLIACGHTHFPRSVRSAGGQLIVNPGSVGLPAYDAQHPYPHAIETGSPDARYAIVEKGAAGWVSSLVAVPYDHRAMAKLAFARERPDWAIALSSGRMGR